MNDWQSIYLGRGTLPRDLSGFEIEAFFTYSEVERKQSGNRVSPRGGFPRQ